MKKTLTRLKGWAAGPGAMNQMIKKLPLRTYNTGLDITSRRLKSMKMQKPTLSWQVNSTLSLMMPL